MVAAAVVGSAVVGGVASAYGAKSAANTQASAAQNAAQAQLAQYQQTREDLSPYTSLGASAINPLLSAMGYTYDQSGNLVANPNSTLQQGFSFNPGDLTQTPGYQFNLAQGERAVNNSAAARGLGLSGAQLKGATSYASGLADTTYQNQFNNALNTYNTNYNTASQNANRLAQLVTAGQNSAAGVGAMGQNATSAAGNYLTSGANASAAGTLGVTNAIGNTANSVSQLALLNQLSKNAGTGSLYGGY